MSYSAAASSSVSSPAKSVFKDCFTPWSGGEVKKCKANFSYEFREKLRDNLYNGIACMRADSLITEDVSVHVFESEKDATEFIKPFKCFWGNKNFIAFHFVNSRGQGVVDVVTERVNMNLSSFITSKLDEMGSRNDTWWVFSQSYFYRIFKLLLSSFKNIFAYKGRNLAFKCSEFSISIDNEGNAKIIGVHEVEKVNRFEEIIYLGGLMRTFVTSRITNEMNAPRDVTQFIGELENPKASVPFDWLLDSCVFWGGNEVRPWIEKVVSIVEDWLHDDEIITLLDDHLLRSLKSWRDHIPSDSNNRLRQGLVTFLEDKEKHSVKGQNESEFFEVAKYYRNTFVYYEEGLDEQHKIHDVGICEVVEKCFTGVGGLCFVLRNAMQKVLFRKRNDPLPIWRSLVNVQVKHL